MRLLCDWAVWPQLPEDEFATIRSVAWSATKPFTTAQAVSELCMTTYRKFHGALAVLAMLVAQGCEVPEAPPTTAAAPTEITAQQALAGVGKQGQSLQDHSDLQKIISGPAATLFNVKQKAVLEIQIPQALQLFQASEGRFPKSHEEFMQKIVEYNRLVLPELPEGAVYHFNTEKGQLWVYPEDEVPN
jgi:hypothetical protein